MTTNEPAGFDVERLRALAEQIEKAICDEAAVWEATFDAGPGLCVGVPDAATVAARTVQPVVDELDALKTWQAKRLVALSEDPIFQRTVSENEELHAKLELPCGSCHPCMNWADETWRRADRKPPTVSAYDELAAELVRVTTERDQLRDSAETAVFVANNLGEARNVEQDRREDDRLHYEAELAAVRAERDQARTEVANLGASHDLMAAQFKVMQREKEHGWTEADKHEARAERAEAESVRLRGVITEVEKLCDAAQGRYRPDTIAYMMPTVFVPDIRRALAAGVPVKEGQ